MRRIIIVVVLLGISAVAYATQVSGDVWGVWDSTMNPIEVIGELRVPEDSSLIIGPGCYIEFQDYYALTLDTSAAFIRAIGTEEDSIIFTPAPGGVWNGIDIFYADSACEFSYCVLEKAHAPIEDLMSAGGAIHCWQSDLEIKNCRITNNRAISGRGGGIFMDMGNLHISNSVISNNFCGFGGSGLYFGLSTESGTAVITGNYFEYDTTFYVLGGEMGGAISCTGLDQIIFSDNRLAHNASYNIGNRIEADTATITFNQFIDNFSLSICGGLHLEAEDTSYIAGNLFENNWVGTLYGGGLYLNGDNSFIYQNVFKENRAAKGGGLYIDGSYIIVLQNLFAYNIGGLDGGGVYTVGTYISLLNNVVAYNTSNVAGGIYGYNTSSSAPITMTNNIVWGNTAASWPQIYIRYHPLDISYCDIEGGWQGVGNIDIDPLFRDTANGDFHLMATYCGDPYDSPCIDVGDPTIQDYFLECDWGLGFLPSDMGAYGGGDSIMQAIEEYIPPMPGKMILLQNYPNPFNSSTTLEFYLSADNEIELSIYNLLGQKIGILHSGLIPAGEHKISWDASPYPSGMYFARLKIGADFHAKKMILLK